MTSGLYTTLGARLWDWEPFVQLEPTWAGLSARNLWLALYTSPAAKRVIPGLFHGSINAMSEAAVLPPDQTIVALDMLLDRELVEFDAKHRVLRLTKLPDPCSSPSNGNVLRGWWKLFCSVPICQVRDAHCATVRWMMDTYASENTPKGRSTPSHDHEKAWSETFGTVPMPAVRRRGVRRLVESDTSTSVQPSLFANRTLTSGSSGDTPPAPQPSVASDGSGTVPRTSSNERSVDNSDSVHQMNDLSSPETVRVTVGSRSGSRSRSSLPDPESDPDPQHTVAEITNSVPLRSHLALVPSLVTFTPEQLVGAIAEGAGGFVRATVPESSQNALRALVAELEADGVTTADLRAAGKLAMLSARGDPLWQDPRIPPDEKLARWLAATPRNAWKALADAREHDRVARAKQEALEHARQALGLGSVRP